MKEAEATYLYKEQPHVQTVYGFKLSCLVDSAPRKIPTMHRNHHLLTAVSVRCSSCSNLGKYVGDAPFESWCRLTQYQDESHGEIIMASGLILCPVVELLITCELETSFKHSHSVILKFRKMGGQCWSLSPDKITHSGGLKCPRNAGTLPEAVIQSNWGPRISI